MFDFISYVLCFGLGLNEDFDFDVNERASERASKKVIVCAAFSTIKIWDNIISISSVSAKFTTPYISFVLSAACE